MSVLGQEFDDAVTRLKTAASNFVPMYNQFVAIPPQYRAPEWADVKAKADTVRAVIQNVTAAIDSAYQWAVNAFGLGNLAGGLGFALPMALPITVGAIGAAISAIMVTYGYMTEQLNKAAYNKRVAETNIQRVEQGLDPISPDSIVPNDPGLFSEISTGLKWVLIGGAALVVVPKILEFVKDYRK